MKVLIRKWSCIISGICLVVLGLILMPVPGPGGTPVFLAGLLLLSSEFKWAKNILHRFKEASQRISPQTRKIITVSAIGFYLVTGVITWNLIR